MYKHQLLVMQGCPLIMKKMSFSGGNLGHMHIRAHHHRTDGCMA